MKQFLSAVFIVLFLAAFCMLIAVFAMEIEHSLAINKMQSDINDLTSGRFTGVIGQPVGEYIKAEAEAGK